MCWLYVQDLKGKILVKGKKEHMVEECSSSSSDLSPSDDEASCTESKSRRKKEDKKVGTTPTAHLYLRSSGSPQFWGGFLCTRLGLLPVEPLNVENSNEDKLTRTSCLLVGLVKNVVVFCVCHLSQVCLSWVQSCQSWWCTPAVSPLKALNKQPKTQQLTCPLSLKVKHSGTLKTQVWCVHVSNPTI